MANEVTTLEEQSEIVEVPRNVPAIAQEWSVAEVVDRVKKVRELYREVMEEGIHFGKIPGTDKPTIYQPGVDLLSMMFRLRADFKSTISRDGEHREVLSHCTVVHIPTGEPVGSAEALCSTRESKYAWRRSERRCPSCGKDTIIKGRPEYGGGWLCWATKGGCGAKWPNGAKEIEGQEVGRVPNPDLADTYNTVIKIANKRSKATAVLNATAGTEIFTVDLDDFDNIPGGETVDRSESQERQEPPKRGRSAKAASEAKQAEKPAQTEPAGQRGPLTGTIREVMGEMVDTSSSQMPSDYINDEQFNQLREAVDASAAAGGLVDGGFAMMRQFHRGDEEFAKIKNIDEFRLVRDEMLGRITSKEFVEMWKILETRRKARGGK